MDWEKLAAVAKDLGMSKEETLKFFENAERVEKERAREAQERAREEQERAREEQERAREVHERAREQHERTLAEQKMEKEILELKVRLALANEVSRDDASVGSGPSTASANLPSPGRKPVCPRKLMAPFDERRDDLDAYLHRFERIAIGQGWERGEWANALSLCLAGEALSVYGRMPATESLDYDLVKKTLLERFRLTAEGFREKFRSCKPENSETGKQFVCRLSNYFDRWMELSETAKTYEGVRDKVVGEQFLNRCSGKLAVFLKERKVGTVEEMARQADQFMEAQGLRNLGKGVGESTMAAEGDAKGQVPMSKFRAQQRCFLCNRPGRIAINCRTEISHNQKAVTCSKCQKRGHKADDCKMTSAEKIACVMSAREGQIEKDMPVVEGEVQRRKATVLRDTGANTVLVRSSLVAPENLTGQVKPVMFVDRTIKYMPEARIRISTPFFTGLVTAKCVEDPLYDLVVGNVPGVRRADDPDPLWRRTKKGVEQSKNIKDLELAEGAQEGAERAAVVETRAENKRDKCLEPLQAAAINQLDITVEKFKELQEKDPSIQACEEKLGEIIKRKKGKTVAQFVKQNGLVYRKCVFSSGKEVMQLMVPEELKSTVLKLGHDSIRAGHQGIKNTFEKITEEFFWIGVWSDVRRYVKSCEVCQRAVVKKQDRKEDEKAENKESATVCRAIAEANEEEVPTYRVKKRRLSKWHWIGDCARRK
ncbi:uncharacterized protein LOC119385403 [Rhipicephalus sanguineus]|uniref:uncharacterized protein LOC119385403 n=1 Tax=Rhipicephalus sanguineus TaxID=34632 RepID=UPI0020C281A8|nr:uncharacterized protein LOC119385403 [Rhipicephalus sanguineus]